MGPNTYEIETNEPVMGFYSDSFVWKKEIRKWHDLSIVKWIRDRLSRVEFLGSEEILN